MITIKKSFEDIIEMPLREMKSSNFIPTCILDDSMKLGLYYLMKIYHLGFRHCTHGNWEWISLSQGEDGDYLSGDQIRELEPDMEVLTKLKENFNKGIYPDGYKRKDESVEEDSKPEFSYKGQYGWLSPTGDFTASEWGTHESSAYDIICEKGWEDEYEEWGDINGIYLARDFLSLLKHYVLIHNPCCDGGYIVTHDNHLTKKQREFLYDYFVAVGDKLRASHYIGED